MAKKDKHDETVQENLLRRFKSNPFLFIGTVLILIIVIVAFVLVPAIPDGGLGGSDLNFGAYNKVPINYVPGNYMAQVRAWYEYNYMRDVSESSYQGMQYQMWRTAFDETVLRMGILDEVKAAGYTPPKNEVDREEATNPDYQENGVFSQRRYNETSRLARIKSWQNTRDNLSTSMYSTDQNRVKTPSKEAAFIEGMASPVRNFDLAIFAFAAYPDSEVRAYGEEHDDLFRSVHLSVITLASEDEARRLLETIASGAVTFEEAAKTNSKDSYADRSGDMGIKAAHEFAAEIPDETERAAVLALEKGATSGIVKVPAGWAFFRAEEAPAAPDLADETALGKVRTYLVDFERGRIEDWLLARAEAFRAEAAAGGAAFDRACAAFGIEKKTFGPLALNYGDAQIGGGGPLFPSAASFGISELSSAAKSEPFWRAAFRTPVGAPAAPLVLGDNILVIFPTSEAPNTAAPAAGTTHEQAITSWIDSNAQQDLRAYFLQNPKLEDRFMDTYIKYFMPQS
ncbi:MAG: peptidylprolyl isomerase [Treponema sp.]|jgi:parvulin-like peptidyl-prolyl isomerase|nr:peptidylprolyl isomerase [Treponema sp.]